MKVLFATLCALMLLGACKKEEPWKTYTVEVKATDDIATDVMVYKQKASTNVFSGGRRIYSYSYKGTYPAWTRIQGGGIDSGEYLVINIYEDDHIIIHDSVNRRNPNPSINESFHKSYFYENAERADK